MLSSFRRDHARATQDADARALVDELEQVSPEFRRWWRRHEVDAPCTGVRILQVDGRPVPFEYTTLTIDEERHLRLVVHARQDDGNG